MNDFSAIPPSMRSALLGAVERVLVSGWYVLGKEVEAFEQQWARACGVGYGIGVGNGMDAIEIALRSLDIGPGDEVITTSMTAFATVLAIMRAGAIPVLADIDPDTALLDPESVRRCLSPRTRAVILVHLYGQVRQMDLWLQLCSDAGIHLVEDCAQAHLATTKGRVAGSIGKVGAFSFYPTKNLGAVGDGGMIVTDEQRIAEFASMFRNYGQSQRYHHPIVGMNSRLDEIQAAMLLEQLKWLPESTERRRAIAQEYREKISNPSIRHLALPEENLAHVYHLFVITCAQRDRLQEHLKSHDIQTLIHYPIPIHHQAPCKDLKVDPMGLKCSERHAMTCLSLPCGPHLSESQVARVIEVVNGFPG